MENPQLFLSRTFHGIDKITARFIPKVDRRKSSLWDLKLTNPYADLIPVGKNSGKRNVFQPNLTFGWKTSRFSPPVKLAETNLGPSQIDRDPCQIDRDPCQIDRDPCH